MSISLLRNREFTVHDRDASPPVLMINETAARRYWPGENPVGSEEAQGRRFRNFPERGSRRWKGRQQSVSPHFLQLASGPDHTFRFRENEAARRRS
jgi:putative ABC transport system permease protein